MAALDKLVESIARTRMCALLEASIRRAEEKAAKIPDSDMRKVFYLQAIESLKEQYREMCGGE